MENQAYEEMTAGSQNSKGLWDFAFTLSRIPLGISLIYTYILHITYVYTYIYIYIYTHTYIYTYMYIWVLESDLQEQSSGLA